MFASGSPPAGSRVAVMTDGGGHASVAADVAEGLGLDVPHFGASLARLVAAELPPSASTVNPVDVAGGGEQDISCFARVCEVVLSSGAVDALVVSGYLGGYGIYGDELAAREVDTARRMAEIARETGRTLVVHSMFPSSPFASALRAGGVPVYRTIEGALRSLSSALAPGPLEVVPVLPAAAAPTDGTGYWDSRALLAASGVPFPVARLVEDRGQLLAASRELSFPVVLKSLGLLHKSDLGGVVLGLADEAALVSAYDDMLQRLSPPACSVEEMADLSDGVELIVGVRQDPRFGPVAMVGLGGVYTEVMHDVATALAPLVPVRGRADGPGPARLRAARGGEGTPPGGRGRGCGGRRHGHRGGRRPSRAGRRRGEPAARDAARGDRARRPRDRRLSQEGSASAASSVARSASVSGREPPRSWSRATSTHSPSAASVPSALRTTSRVRTLDVP